MGKGAIVLMLSGFICKLFGAFFRLPLTNIIGIEGIGAFQMIMSLYSLMLVLTTGGVTVTLSRLVSSSRARGENDKIGAYLRIALLFSVGIALGLGFGFFILARNIASVQGIGNAFLSYKLVLPLLVLGALIGVFRGIIQGYENMVPTAVSQIIEQVIKFALGLAFAFYFAKRGQGVFGAMLGITVSEALALIYLLGYMIAKIHPQSYNANVSTRFFKAVIPLSLCDAVMPLTHAVDSLVIVSRMSLAGFAAELATSLYGLQTGVVGAILNFPLVISLAVSMALLPKISFLSSTGERERQKGIISMAFTLMWTLLLPMALGLMALAPVIYPLIYPTAIKNLLNEAVALTFIGGVSIILNAIMQFTLSVSQANGHYNFSLLATFIGGVVKVLIVIFTASVPAINIFAIPLSNIAMSIVVCVILLINLGRLISIPAFEVLTPLLSAFVMFLAVWIFVKTASLSPIITILCALIVGGVTYILLAMPVILSLLKKLFGKKLTKEEEYE